MSLDRGRLAKIDRKVLSGLDHGESWRIVRLPVSDALWSAWRRYCAAIGISMGRAIAALIEHELRSVLEGPDGDHVSVTQVEARAAERRQIVASRVRSSARAADVGRNDPCPCGTGLKHKRCHGAPTARGDTRSKGV